MSKTFEKIQALAVTSDIQISEHEYDELSNDNLTAREIIEGIKKAVLIEDYPNYPKGANFISALIIYNTRYDILNEFL